MSQQWRKQNEKFLCNGQVNVPSFAITIDVSFSDSLTVNEWIDAMVDLLRYHGTPLFSYAGVLYHQETNRILNHNDGIQELGILQGDHFIFY